MGIPVFHLMWPVWSYARVHVVAYKCNVDWTRVPVTLSSEDVDAIDKVGMLHWWHYCEVDVSRKMVISTGAKEVEWKHTRFLYRFSYEFSTGNI